MPLDLARLTDSPTYRSLTAAVPTDPSAVLALTDWLQDQGATLAEVLLLFAGTPPEWVDGLPQPVLVEWCRATEPDRREYPMAAVDVRRPLIFRWQAVREVSIEQYQAQRTIGALATICHGIEAIAADAARFLPVGTPWDDLCEIARGELIGARRFACYSPGVLEAVVAALARARRWLKRQVLALFPEVVCGEYEVVDLNNSFATCRQTIHAPDLILPEMPSSDEMRQAYRAMTGLRAVDQERMRQSLRDGVRNTLQGAIDEVAQNLGVPPPQVSLDEATAATDRIQQAIAEDIERQILGEEPTP